MKQKLYTMRDFSNSMGIDILTQCKGFQKFVDQANSFGHQGYWAMSHSGVGATMCLEEDGKCVSAFISNDYLGMSQRNETKHNVYFTGYDIFNDDGSYSGGKISTDGNGKDGWRIIGVLLK